MQKDWQVIVSHKDMNERIGVHNDPKPIGQQVYEFANKEQAVKKHVQVINKYSRLKGYYETKSHGTAAFKIFYKKEQQDFLTYVLLYYKGEEYSSLPFEDLIEAGLK